MAFWVASVTGFRWSVPRGKAGPEGGYQRGIQTGDTNGGYNGGYNRGPTGVLERNQTRLSVPIGFAVIQPDFLVHMNICWRTGLARQWLEEWPANGRTDHSHEDSRAHRVRSTDPYAGMTRMEAGHRALPDEQCAVRREMRMPQMTGEVL